MLIKLLKFGSCFILLTVVGACASFSATKLPQKYTQYHWSLREWKYPLFEANKEQPIRVDFDNGAISITSLCNRFYSDIKLDEQKITFKKLHSSNIACNTDENKQDQLIVNAIQNAQITKIDQNILVMQPQNPHWQPLTFSSIPKANQEGVNSYLWEVDAKKYPCMLKSGISSGCLRIRELPSGNWFLLTEPIEGFTFKEGVRYRLKVLETLKDNKIVYILDGIVGQILIGTRQSSPFKFLP